MISAKELSAGKPVYVREPHCACWRARAWLTSSVVQFCVRHVPAALWNAVDVHTHPRSVLFGRVAIKQ